MLDDEFGTLIFKAIGETGRYQTAVTFLIFLSRITVNWHPLLTEIVAPPTEIFTCSDPSFLPCDEACPGHKFNHTIWKQTIIHEWDLVCGRKFIPNIVQSVIMSGFLVGYISFGYLADKYGRHRSLVLGVVIQLLSGVSAAFTSSLWLYVVMRWITAFATCATMYPIFSILMEFTNRRYRAVIGVLFMLPSHIGHALLGPIGYYGNRWNYIQLIVSVPSFILLIYWFTLPESPRWLLLMGKTEKLIRMLEIGAKRNKLPTEHIRSDVENFMKKNLSQEQIRGGNVKDLFRTGRMRTKTIVVCINWMVIAMSFFGLAQYIGQMGKNLFWSIGASGLIQIPANLFTCLLVGLVDRKYCLISSYLISVCPLFLTSALYEQAHFSHQILACFSIMGNAACFSLIQMYSAELFPTAVRTLGLGVASMCGQLGTMIAPYITDEIFGYEEWVPSTVFALFSFVGAGITLIFLPDTRGKAFTNTVEEADEI